MSNRLTNGESREARLNYNAGVRDELQRRGAVQTAVDRLMEGMDAVTATGSPDWRNRRENSMAVLAYAEGRPIEMVYQVSEKISTLPALATLAATPEGRAKLLAAVADGERDGLKSKGKASASNNGVSNDGAIPEAEADS